MSKAAVLVLSLLLSLNVLALKPGGVSNSLLAPLKSNVEPPISTQSYDFEGIVKLSNCSGSLVRFKGQPLDTKGIVLTNGHCVSRRFIKPGQIILNKRDRRRMRVADTNMRFTRIRAEKILYGTMTGTDAALFRIEQTYEELERKGISALELSDVRPYVDTEIEVISGYWERGYSCHIEKFIHQMREADWVFEDSLRYSRPGCETIGGTSGSPIIDKDKRTVIGVNNTGNESGRECTMNNPCEVDANGNVNVIKGASYGQQTYWFYDCVTPDYEIDPNLPGCKLTK
ncbi:MAG: serine protease [Halobacteriovoraceae bacterium]|nr:serine protease [Halobacteriovoraceae bacterium]